jgi:hypothetical protein
MHRSYLFAPGNNQKLLRRVFDAGADAVILDLGDAVPPEAKDTARALVAEALLDDAAWVRVNAPRTERCAADLDAVAGRAAGAWAAERTPGSCGTRAARDFGPGLRMPRRYARASAAARTCCRRDRQSRRT